MTFIGEEWIKVMTSKQLQDVEIDKCPRCNTFSLQTKYTDTITAKQCSKCLTIYILEN